MGYAWTPLEIDILEQWFGLIPVSEIAARISQASGRRRTTSAVHQYASSHGIDHRTNQDGISVSDAARAIGVGIRGFLKKLRREGVPLRGVAGVRLLSYEDYERIAASYPDKH